jgi:NtrC-family two-component system response regulator AlgB
MGQVNSGEQCLRVLVVDDEENIRLTLSICLEADGHRVTAAATIDDAIEIASRHVFDLILLDLRLGVHNGLDYIPRFLQDCPWTKIVVITAHASVATAVKAMQLGAIDYLPKPFTPAQVQLVTQKVSERRRVDLKIDALQSALGELDPEADLPTDNPQMRRAIELARHASDSSAAVLICGEAGTGKGRLARSIHAWSKRSQAAYANVWCEASDATTLDAELFGLTAADAGRAADLPGRVDLCSSGTLCLEGVVQAPPSLQPKLHRLIVDKEFERHNDFRPQTANVRVIGTSCCDPEDAVRRRRLRPELLLALDVIRIDIPPLRNRSEDIPMLAKRYLAYFGKENHRLIARFSSDAMAALRQYAWPGNTRELRNLIERAVILCSSDEIGLRQFPPNLLNVPVNCAVGDLVPLDTIENLHIRRVIESTGSIKGAAEVLGIGVSTIVRWMKRLKPEDSVAVSDQNVAAIDAGAMNAKSAG